jgi:signal transduction histidine kinase
MEADLRALTEGLEQMVSERTKELARTIRELQKRALQLQRLTMELSEVEDRERRRLARILHDDLQQLLVGAKLHLDVLGNKLPASGDAMELMERLRRLILESIEKSRGLSHELSPPALYQGGVGDALTWLGRRMQETCGLNVTVEVDEGCDFGPETLRSFVYKAAQEMLFNVVKHAGVSEARIRLRHRNGQVRLTVVDSGSGFDPESLGRTDGFGLFSIRERASLMGGWMRCRSIPQKGSIVVLMVPSD